MKRNILYLLLICILTGACSRDNNAAKDTMPQHTDTLPALIMQVQKCSRMYTAEYSIRKIVTHDDVIRLKGSVLSRQFDVRMPIGDRKIAIPMSATVKAYIDFDGFSADNVRIDGRHVTVILPDPRIVMTASKIDHHGIREYVALTRSHFSDAEMAAYEQQGRASIIASIHRMGILDTARDNAARILIPMLEQMGFDEKAITITFSRSFSQDDMLRMLDTGTAGDK